MSSTSTCQVAAMLRISVALVTCRYSQYVIILITHDKMVERKMVTRQGCGLGTGGCKGLCPVANRAWLGYTFFLVCVG